MAVKEIKEIEMSVLSAQCTAEYVAKMVSNASKLGLTAVYLPAMMLWGPPGVGKSDAVRQAAEMIKKETGKRVVVTDVRLLLYNPVDLRGIPVADEHKEFAVWLRPKIFMMDDSEDVINLLFLDELTAAPQSVQAAAYQITLDRMVGEHRLPDNCVVIAAGNRVTDRSVSFKMPKALSNRLCHMEVEADFAAWRKWAMTHDIDLSIIGFLTYDPTSLMKFGDVTEELAFPTPRSWEMASRYVKLCGNVFDAMPFITGCVGRSAASALLTWTKVHSQLPSIEDIFDGKAVNLPNRPDVLYALASAVINHAEKPETTLEQVMKSVKTIVRLPADYAMLIFKRYVGLEGKSENMMSEMVKNRDFAAWLTKNERYLNV